MSREGGRAAGEQVGGLSEEAARLGEALGGWLRDALGGLDAHVANGSPECRVCPVCRLIASVRSTRPELAAHLADAAGSLLAALGTLSHPHADAAQHDADAHGEPPRVQRIVVD